MSLTDKNTEQKILVAARKVFVIRGFDGSTMQEIADEAGLNKALLHYYFRSKEKLFHAVFIDILSGFIPKVENIIISNLSFHKKIELFIDNYIDLLMSHPLIPGFMLREINRDPDSLFDMFKSSGIKPEKLISLFQTEISNEKIKNTDPENLFINILALCIFPFAAKPLMQRIMFNNDEKIYLKFLQNRKKEITQFVINAISK